MKKLTRIVFAVALGQWFLTGTASAQSEADTAAVEARVSIEQCYDMARENYPMLKKYDLINLSEKYNLKMASHAYIPQVALTGRATYQNETLEFPFKIPEFMGTIPVFSKDQYQVALEVTQIIWDGGLTATKKDKARAEAESTRKQFEVDMYALRGRINDIYFGILLLEEQKALNEIMVQQLQDNAQRVLKCMENGVASQSDYDMIDVEMISANQNQVQLETMQRAYEDMLSVMIGRKVSAASLIKPLPVLQTPVQLMADLYCAGNLRPELKLMDARLHEIEVQENSLYSFVMPRFGLFLKGMYGRPGLNFMDNDMTLNTIGGITMTWNFGALYDLRSGRSLIRNSRKELEVMKETFLFNMDLQFRSQIAESEKYTQLMADDDKIIGLRSRIRQSVEAEMENGTKNASDLILELGKEQAARQQKLLHEIEMMKSVYELKDIKNQY